MSKLFTSLELSPENFLHLQAAAKAYMLDDDHPERRDCVGQRGKGDTEMVKLRLWNCVRDFLEAEQNGERYFGEHVVSEGMGPRTLIWPRDQHKIISLVIPLLRRMVTNERQRQYAIETRKGGGEERKSIKTDESFSNLDHPAPEALKPLLPLPLPPPQQEQQLEGDVELGLLDLLLEGYPTDWDTVARSYDAYNQDYQLDNLWTISGLPQQDWRGLVAAVDSHYQIHHNGVSHDCVGPCEDCNVRRIVSSDSLAHSPWRVGNNSVDDPARNDL
jgi:hypothetical protein